MFEENLMRAASLWVIFHDDTEEARKQTITEQKQGFLYVPVILEQFLSNWQGLPHFRRFIGDCLAACRSTVRSRPRLQFREITPPNWREIQPKVAKEQERFVASYITTLARAYVYRNNNAVVYAVYCEETPIGILMQRDHLDDEGNCVCTLDQFFIDQAYQGEASERLL